MKVELQQSEVDRVKPGSLGQSGCFAAVDGASLAVFRIGFGSVMALWAAVELILNRVAENYVNTAHLFKYPGFQWVSALSPSGLYAVYFTMCLTALAVALGAAYRIAASIFCVAFTYVFLLDQTTYQNHYYLVCLLSALLCVVPADRTWSLKRSENLVQTVPAWAIWILRFQIGCVYFFGGVAKLNADWLSGSPMRNSLDAMTSHPLIVAIGQNESLVQFLTWGGLLFDLLIVPALLWKRSRTVAFVIAVMFHLTNAALFPIGIFPWLMLFATTIFFEPSWPRQILPVSREVPADSQSSTQAASSAIRQRLTLVLLTAYATLQLIIPLRHFAYPGNVDWTEEGHAFSWHMMLRGKVCAVRFHVRDPRTGRSAVFPLKGVLQPHQVARMSRDPRLIRDFADFIAATCRGKGVPDVEVRAFALCSLNGRKPQLLVDPERDLTSRSVSSDRADWVVPLHEPLTLQGWKEPLRRWEELVTRDPHMMMPR